MKRLETFMPTTWTKDEILNKLRAFEFRVDEAPKRSFFDPRLALPVVWGAGTLRG